MITIERPYLLFLILIIVPVFIFNFAKYKKIEYLILNYYSQVDSNIKRLRFSFFSKIITRCFAWCFGILALSGISFGTRQFPVQKSGCAVSFVFDISYSMNATDEKGYSRIEAMKIYAKNLLAKMDGISVSAVIAKGDGFLAVPLTEDFSSIDALIESLSPHLMTSVGSSIGKGVNCAISSFPQNSAQSNMIFVFTDGDETDDSLYPSLLNAVKYQIPVFLIGFGSEDGVEVIAGDGKTPVQTFLMANKMKNLSSDANKNAQNFSRKELVHYVQASAKSSATFILKKIESNSEVFAYEIRSVSRHVLFLLIAVILLVLSFILSEIDIATISKRFSKATMVLLVTPLFFSCSSERMKILDGAWNHYNSKYRSAIVDFVSIFNETDDEKSKNYALFGLSSTYIALEEYDVALDKLNQIIPEMEDENYKNPKLMSAAFYNEGVIYERKGDFSMAREMFKKAILADSDNIDAKINLELCIQQEKVNKQKSGATELQNVSESKSDDLDSKTQAIFNLIRENERNQWKKMEKKEDEDNGLDY